jgi:hypothetical protein
LLSPYHWVMTQHERHKRVDALTGFASIATIRPPHS